MFISSAYAQSAAGAPAAPVGGALMGFAPFVLVFLVFYFLFIRPQNKKYREHQAMLGALKKGDKVVTSGGIYGTVVKVDGDKTVVLEIADGVKVTVAKYAVSALAAVTPDVVK